MRQDTPLEVVAKGAIAGLVGTAVMTVVMQTAPKLMQQAGIQPPPPPKSPEGEEPTAKLAGKVAEEVLETPVDEETKASAGQAIHWGYGSAWGAFYGLVQGSLHLPALLHGAVFGALVSGVAMTLVPTMRLTPPPDKQQPQQQAMMFGSNLLYGLVTALTFQALAGGRHK